MLKNVHLKNFHGFKDTKIGPLKRINLIVGQNNTGKTGLLEALALLLADVPQNAHNLPQLFRSSGGDTIENFWKWICYNKNVANAVEIHAGFTDLPDFGVCLAQQPPPTVNRHIGSIGGLNLFTFGQRVAANVKCSVFSTYPTNPRQDAIDYNRVVLRRKKGRVEALLKKLNLGFKLLKRFRLVMSPCFMLMWGLAR